MESLTLGAWWNAGRGIAVAAVLQVGCSGTSTPPPSDASTGSQSAAGFSSLGAGGHAGNGGSSGTVSANSGGTNQVGGAANTLTGGAIGSGGAIGNNTGGAIVPTGGASGSVGGTNPSVGGSNTTGGANMTVGGAATGGINAVTGGANGTVGGTISVAGASGTDPCAAITCTGGRQCVAGACQCPTGYSFCGGVCLLTTDLQSNPSNCGTCANLCATGAACTAGVCQCGAGQTACAGSCVNMQTDATHCGTCATSCPSGVCTAGVCQKVKDCFTKTIITNPLLADFETYDGTTAAASWGWAFNAPAGTAGAVYAGFYNSNDGTGTPTLGLVAPGYNSSKYTANIANTLATGWGGQLGVWMGCIDASPYQGISFWVQGTAPTGKANLTLSTENTTPPDSTGFGGGTCTTTPCTGPSIDFAVTNAWTQVLVPWGTFKAGAANGSTVATTGNGITGLSWNVSLNYTCDSAGLNCVAAPAGYNLSVNNIQFMANTSCTSGLTLCGTGCVDTKTNNANCGACGTACPSPQTCGAGACQCPSGYTNCNGQCVNTQIDVANCGACGKACSGVCSAGTCAASSCTANMAKKDTTSTAYASIILGKYWINNNVWGASGASGSQSIWDTCSSGNTIGWGTSWTWSGGSNGQVKSYASAVLGWQWGWKVTSGTGLPVQISANKNVTCGWTYRVNPGQTIDVSYDLFVHSIANPGTNDNPTDEIMIWLYRSGGAGPIGGTQATVSLAGSSWELHQGNNGNWNVYSYVNTTNQTSATLNLMDFLKDLVSRGWMTSSKYLSSVQAGTEVFVGTGELDTDSYYCTIQ